MLPITFFLDRYFNDKFFNLQIHWPIFQSFSDNAQVLEKNKFLRIFQFFIYNTL